MTAPTKIASMRTSTRRMAGFPVEPMRRAIGWQRAEECVTRRLASRVAFAPFDFDQGLPRARVEGLPDRVEPAVLGAASAVPPCVASALGNDEAMADEEANQLHGERLSTENPSRVSGS